MATIRQRGKNWQAVVRLKQEGREHQESRSFASERLAKDWAARLEANIKLNGIPQRALATATLGELILKYKEARNAVKPVRRQMNWELDQLADAFKNTKLNHMSAKVFADFGRRRFAEGKATGATILHNLATVRGVLNAAKPMFDLHINGDPVTEAVKALSRLGAVRRSESRTRRPTAEEIEKLRETFRRIAGHRCTVIPMETIMDIALALPRRLGELMDMRWTDYTGTQIILRDTKNPKAPRTEIIPVPEQAASIINSLPKFDACILPYKTESVSAAWQRACLRADIHDLHFHDLRHEGITRLFAAGLDIPEVSLISGHQSWAMLRRYTHITPEAVLEKLNAHRQEA